MRIRRPSRSAMPPRADRLAPRLAAGGLPHALTRSLALSLAPLSLALALSLPGMAVSQAGPPAAGAEAPPRITLPGGGARPGARGESPDALTILPVGPLQRDGGAAQPATPRRQAVAPDAGWMMPLRPEGRVPAEPAIGPSRPGPGVLRISGEAAQARFTLDLPAGIAPSDELVLDMRSSVNLLPELSSMTVTVNGETVTTVPLDRLSGFESVVIDDVPLVSGSNTVELDLTQHHRIFCGPDASFGVWTEIRLGQSGAPVSLDDMPLNIEGVMSALLARASAEGVMTFQADSEGDASLIAPIMARFSDYLGFLPQIRIHSPYAAAGGSEQRSRITLLDTGRQAVRFTRGGDGALVMVIEHDGDEMPDLDVLLPAPPELPEVPLLVPGQTTTFDELGVPRIVGRTRYSRDDVTFMLPEDWLILASQRVRMTLNYGFSRGLPEGSILLFKVNGQTRHLLPLDESPAGIQPPLEMQFPANLLNQGINRLTFEAIVPGDPADMACAPRAGDIMVILGETELTVPTSPAMVQADMLTPLMRLDATSVDAPGTSAAEAAEELLPLRALMRPIGGRDGPARLNVVGLDGVGLIPVGNSGITHRMIQDAIFPGLSISGEAPADPSGAAPRQRREPAYTLAVDPDDGDDDGPDASEGAEDEGLFAIVSTLSVRGAVRDSWEAARDLVLGQPTSLADWIATRNGRALLLQPDLGDPETLWLAIGPDTPLREVALQVDRFRRDVPGRHGQAALLTDDGTWAVWNANPAPQLLEPLSVWNLRSVLGNYASWMPSLFTLGILVLALLSILPALLYVMLTRRPEDRT